MTARRDVAICIGTLLIACLPVVGMTVKWGPSQVIYDLLNYLPSAVSAFVGFSMMLAAAAWQLVASDRRIGTILFCLLIVFAALLIAVGEVLLYMNLVGCC